MAASAADQSAPASHLSVKWLLLGLAVATTVVFVVIKILASGSGQVAEAVDAESETPASVTTSDAGSGSASPRDGVQKQGDAVAQRAILSPDAGVAPKPVAPKATRKAAGKVQTAKAVSAEPTPGPKAEPVAAAPRPAPPRAVEAPRDPWQVMNEGLSRCAREDFFSRIACEQRLRLQYCPNHWGTVPQCPIGPATDHGQ